MAITRLFGFIGATAGGTLGWWLGARIGLFTAFVLSTVGTGIGLYVALRLAREYLG